MTAKVGGGSRGGGGDYGSSGEETVENPWRGKSKTTAVNKTGGGGGTWESIPSREVDETLLCGAANGDRVRVKIMFALVGGPHPSVRWMAWQLAGPTNRRGGAVRTATISGTTVPPPRRILARGRNTQDGFG